MEVFESCQKVDEGETGEKGSKIEALLVEAKEFGEGYKKMLVAIRDGYAFETTETGEESGEFLKSISEAVDRRCKTQDTVISQGNLEPWDLLSRTVRAKGIELDKERDTVERIFPNSKIPILKAGLGTYKRIEPGSRALSIKPRDWVSFVVIRDNPNSADLLNEAMEEDIPHELHHIVYEFANKEGLLQNDETDPAIAEGYSVFRDEICARLCSEGPLSGYTQLNGASRAKLESIGVEKINELTARTVDLNTVLEGLEQSLRGSDVKKSDLLLPALQAKSFQELKDFFEAMKDIAEKESKDKPEQTATGWGFA